MRLSYGETADLLQKHGIPMCHQGPAESLEGILENAKGMAAPFVLKVWSKSISHKTEKGLIKLNLGDKFAVKQAYWELAAKTRASDVDCFLIQEQVPGAEFIIGGARDPAFGPVVLFGAGGVLVELFKDASFRAAPLSVSDALDLISESKASAFFAPGGVRGRKVSKEPLVHLLLKTGELLLHEPSIESLDFNPVIANDREALVVDARITVDDPKTRKNR